MTEARVLLLALKALGVYCIILAIAYFAPFLSTLTWFTRSIINDFHLIIGFVTPMGLLLITAFVFIRYSEAIVRRIFPSSESTLITIQGSETQWYSLALTLMGMLLLIEDVPRLIASIAANLFAQINQSDPRLQTRIVEGKNVLILQLIIKIPVGLFLVFGSKRIAKFLTSR